MLMEGITIINQTDIVKPNVIFIILGFVLIAISAIVCITLFLKKRRKSVLLSIICWYCDNYFTGKHIF